METERFDPFDFDPLIWKLMGDFINLIVDHMLLYRRKENMKDHGVGINKFIPSNVEELYISLVRKL